MRLAGNWGGGGGETVVVVPDWDVRQLPTSRLEQGPCINKRVRYATYDTLGVTP